VGAVNEQRFPGSLSGPAILLLVILLRVGTRLASTLIIGLVVTLLRVTFLVVLTGLIALLLARLLAGVIFLFLVHVLVASFSCEWLIRTTTGKKSS